MKRSEAREMAGYEWDADDEIYASVSTEGEQMVEDGGTMPPSQPDETPEAEPTKVLQFKIDPDATGSDAVLDAAIPWLLESR